MTDSTTHAQSTTDSPEADFDPSEADLDSSEVDAAPSGLASGADPGPTEREPPAAGPTPDRSASPPAYRGVCRRCETAVDTDAANDLVAFYRRHHRVTGHEVTVERAPVAAGADDVDAAAGASGTAGTAGADSADGIDPAGADDTPPTVVDVVRSRQAAPEAGPDSAVPVGVVAAVLNAHGVGIGETLTRIHDRRLTGVLYEPTDDHLRAL